MKLLDTLNEVKVPPLNDVIALNESVALAAGALTPATIRGIALNTAALTENDAQEAIAAIQTETGLPVTDPVRYGAEALAKAIQLARNSRQ